MNNPGAKLQALGRVVLAVPTAHGHNFQRDGNRMSLPRKVLGTQCSGSPERCQFCQGTLCPPAPGLSAAHFLPGSIALSPADRNSLGSPGPLGSCQRGAVAPHWPDSPPRAPESLEKTLVGGLSPGKLLAQIKDWFCVATSFTFQTSSFRSAQLPCSERSQG